MLQGFQDKFRTIL